MIELNGAPHALGESRSLQDLVASLELLNKPLAIAVNRQVVPRDHWPSHVLQGGERVDIVRAIGGG